MTNRERLPDPRPGFACDSYGQFAMKRAGTCLTCMNCGATTGCS
ncbi:hypothetical protein [Hansschlegelia plantiphila]|nr:hypothetical protein [Hansschlegelia plantiphila]